LESEEIIFSPRKHPLRDVFETLNLAIRMAKKRAKGKKAVIVVRLVKESLEKDNSEIEKEILQELQKELPVIPWLESVEKVTVTEE
jgi:RNase P protein component